MKKPAKSAKPRRGKHWYSSDRPIESKRADVLGRSGFAEQLAHSICAWDGRDSLVIALHGGWGTGKTSVKNMVLERLRSRRARCPQIVNFSPWQVSGSGNLLEPFFDELAGALGKGEDRPDGLGAKFSAYATKLSLFARAAKPIAAITAFFKPQVASEVLAGSVAVEQTAQLVETVAEELKRSDESDLKSLSELKADLKDSLASLQRSVLVVIDDIDRLTTDEILQVFQLVKVNADFPNLVYLLLFERSIIESALDRISGDRGHEFLQKIVQVEFHVPHAHRKAVEKVLFTGLDRAIDQESVKYLFDKDRWRELYTEGVSKYFDNLRNVYRFLGSFEFHFAHFTNGGSIEVNPIDLIGLETLRVFEPGLYEMLPFAKRILTREQAVSEFRPVAQEEVDATVAQLLANVPEGRRPQAEVILSRLFPPLSKAFDDEDGVSAHKGSWMLTRRVCHSDLFDKYFTLVVGEGDLSQAELDRLISLTGDRLKFLEECRSLMKRGLLQIAFERLGVFKDRVPLASVPALIGALCDLGDELPEPIGSPFEPALAIYACELIYGGLTREADPGKRSAILLDAFRTSPGIALPLDIVRMVTSAREEGRPSRVQLVEESGLVSLKAECVRKITEAATKPGFWDGPDFMAFMSAWFIWGDQNEVRRWVGTIVTTGSEAVGFIRRLLGRKTATGAGQTRVTYYVHLKFVEQFIGLDRLISLTSELQGDCFEALDRTALLEFRKALRRREEGQPDGVDPW
jgi:predicted KAP-like P-loop ATPase